MWWCSPVSLAFGRLEQENPDAEDSLGYTARFRGGGAAELERMSNARDLSAPITGDCSTGSGLHPLPSDLQSNERHLGSLKRALFSIQSPYNSVQQIRNALSKVFPKGCHKREGQLLPHLTTDQRFPPAIGRRGWSSRRCDTTDSQRREHFSLSLGSQL